MKHSGSDTKQAEAEVRQYYNDNSKSFLRFGQNAGSSAIHQPLYLHSNMPLREAIHSQHFIIAGLISSLDEKTPDIYDLGCGTGGSMQFLAGLCPGARFTGITISEEQARLGMKSIARAGLGERCRILPGSFLEIPEEKGAVDLCYAIESFIHAPDGSRFFEEAERILKPGGQLVLFDDFLSGKSRTISQNESAILEDFRRYWKANTLLGAGGTTALAANFGFQAISTTDYTPALRLNRPRDRMIRFALLPFLELVAPAWPYTSFLRGGNARQLAYMHGMLSYCCFVFTRN